MTATVTDDRLDSPVAAPLVAALLQELFDRYGQEDPDPDHLTAEHFAAPGGAFVVARSGPTPVACGGVCRHDETTGELKRIFVTPAARGGGVGRVVLDALEARARRLGYRRLILETGVRQPEALALYASAGYTAIDPYGAYRSSPLSRCFAKPL